MKNENRAVFDRASEPCDFALTPPTTPHEHAAEQSVLWRPLRWIAERLHTRRNRMALLELSDEALKDIGVSRCQADGGYSRYRQSNSHALERKIR